MVCKRFENSMAVMISPIMTLFTSRYYFFAKEINAAMTRPVIAGFIPSNTDF